MQVERMDGVKAAAGERENCEERKRRKTRRTQRHPRTASDRQRLLPLSTKGRHYNFFANWLIHFLKGCMYLHAKSDGYCAFSVCFPIHPRIYVNPFSDSLLSLSIRMAYKHCMHTSYEVVLPVSVGK